MLWWIQSDIFFENLMTICISAPTPNSGGLILYPSSVIYGHAWVVRVMHGLCQARLECLPYDGRAVCAVDGTKRAQLLVSYIWVNCREAFYQTSGMLATQGLRAALSPPVTHPVYCHTNAKLSTDWTKAYLLLPVTASLDEKNWVQKYQDEPTHDTTTGVGGSTSRSILVPILASIGR